MFKNRKSRILFRPEEEKPVTLEKTREEFIGIDSIEVETQYRNMVLGVLIDYNGVEYDFEWDLTKNKLAKLSGETLNPTFIQLAIVELSKYFTPKPEPKPIPKEPTLSVSEIEKIVESVIKKEEPTPEPIIIPEPEIEIPQMVIVEEDRDLFESDDDLARHAQKLLESISSGVDLGKEYTEL